MNSVKFCVRRPFVRGLRSRCQKRILSIDSMMFCVRHAAPPSKVREGSGAIFWPTVDTFGCRCSWWTPFCVLGVNKHILSTNSATMCVRRPFVRGLSSRCQTHILSIDSMMFCVPPRSYVLCSFISSTSLFCPTVSIFGAYAPFPLDGQHFLL